MTGLSKIQTKHAREILMESGAWPAIIRAAALDTGQIGDVAITVRDVILETDVIDMSRPETAAMVQAALAGLVAAQMMSEETKNKLLALADQLDDRVRLHKGHPVLNGTMVVLNTGDYRLDELVECARASVPDESYGALLCSMIVGGA